MNTIRRVDPPEVTLARLFNSAATVPATVIPFAVPVPDARVQVSVTVVAVADPGTAGLTIPYNVLGRTAGGSALISAGLWLAAATNPASGGGLIPITNLVGVRASPQLIPFDTGLQGLGFSVLDSVDAVIGELTIAQIAAGGGDTAAPPCAWLLKTRFQPVAGAEICDDEWNQIVSRCTPAIRGPALVSL